MKPHLGVLFSALLASVQLGGCAFSEEALWPSVTGEPPAGQARAAPAVVVTAPREQTGGAAAAGSESYRAPGLTPGSEAAPPGETQGQLVQELTAEQAALDARDGRLQDLRRATAAAGARFAERAAAINKRLKASAAPGDDALEAEWQKAQEDHRAMADGAAGYRALAEENDAAAGRLRGLLMRARAEAAAAPAARRPGLTSLAGDIERTLAVVEALSTALAGESAALQGRAALSELALAAMAAAIANGAYVGDALARRAAGQAAPAPPGGAAGLVGTAEPLAVIRFEDADADFEPALFSIVYAALGRRPNAGFDLVGVSPDRPEAAADSDDGGAPSFGTRLDSGRANAQRVRRALLSMGLPAGRMTLATATSPAAATEEVHIYVR